MRRLYAVARETFIESLRTRVIVVFSVLLAACLVTMALTIEGDGTLKGRIQTFLAYGTSAVQLLLGLVTIFLATGIVAGDIRRKTVFTVATKPLARWQYVLGRWAGVVAVAGVLLLLATAATYGLTQYLRGRPTPMEQKKALGQAPQGAPDPDRRAVETELLTARTEHHPRPFNVEDEVRHRLGLLQEERRMDDLIRARIRRELEGRRAVEPEPDAAGQEEEVERRFQDARTRQRIQRQIEADVRDGVIEAREIVQPGLSVELVFEGLSLPPGGAGPLQLRYRLQPLRAPESRILKSVWQVQNPRTGRNYYLFRDDSAETVSSFTLPADVIAADGRIVVSYQNLYNPEWLTAVKIKPEEVTLLYRVGGFEGNLARAAGLMLLRVMFLAGAGVLVAAFLSFPIACLVCLILLGICMMGSFIEEATRITQYTEPTAMDYFSSVLGKVVFVFLPSFSGTSPTDSLVDGLSISGRTLARELAVIAQPAGDEADWPWRALGFRLQAGVGLRTWMCLLVACLVFRRRELARVQV